MNTETHCKQLRAQTQPRYAHGLQILDTPLLEQLTVTMLYAGKHRSDTAAGIVWQLFRAEKGSWHSVNDADSSTSYQYLHL